MACITLLARISRPWGFLNFRNESQILALEKPAEMVEWTGFRQVTRLLELCQDRDKGRVSVACRKIAPNRSESVGSERLLQEVRCSLSPPSM